jgi:proteasome lid subunit RPN8/RPN11
VPCKAWDCEIAFRCLYNWEVETSIPIAKRVLEKMLSHARAEAPLECCGLLAGRDGVISEIFPAKNALASKTAYEIAPAQLFEIFRTLRAQQLDILGIYHSHPHSENAPSPTDVTGANYPDTPYFIISLLPGAQNPIRAFQISDSRVTELTISVE